MPLLLAALISSGCDSGKSAGFEDNLDASLDASSGQSDASPPLLRRAEQAGDSGQSAQDDEQESYGPTGETCFPAYAPDKLNWSYDEFNPVIGSHCKGTDHQDIEGIEKVVFLGDSITAGTFPTSQAGFYRNLLVSKLESEFGELEVDNCSSNGAVTADLLAGERQILSCFPGVEEKRTLVVITLGGNDIQGLAFSKTPAEQALPMIDAFMEKFRSGIQWFSDPSIFPNGVFVIFSNVYEFTDGTADLSTCPALSLFGSGGVWKDGIEVFGYMANSFLEIAVDTGRDVIFLAESFCGHGLSNGDASGPCAGLTDGTVWFGGDCIHPNSKGHAAIADLFFSVIME